MDERRAVPRNRTFFGGRIVFNSGRAAIDCTVRNLSGDGACLEVPATTRIPERFYLIVGSQGEPRPCKAIWRSADRLGISFGNDEDARERSSSPDAASLSFSSALNEIDLGIVLLDDELRAQFINRAFRKMFRLPDAKADSKPPFVALMYHGRDSRAYEIPRADLDQYVADRVARVRAGDPRPLDIRLSDGEVLRLQCAVLPGGGRMLSYTYVTDIVRQADELEILREALNRVREGIVLLDGNLNAAFINQSVRELWKIPDEQAQRRPNIAELVGDAATTGTYGVAAQELPQFIARRIRQIRQGDPTPTDLRTADGRIIRSQCDRLPSGGRMLTYCDVTDLVRAAEQMESLATVDVVTGIHNRRHFMAVAEREWSRFQRYHRPLSVLVIDVDHFKAINDRFGHDVGDAALRQVAALLQSDLRTSDVAARFGGDEFVLLLPETDVKQASVVAARLCGTVRGLEIAAAGQTIKVTLSVGVAGATVAMSGIVALMKAADQALYQAKSRGRDQFATADTDTKTTGIAAE